MNAKLILIPIFLIGSCVAQDDINNLVYDVFIKNPPNEMIDQMITEPNLETTDYPVTAAASKNLPPPLTGNSFNPCDTRPDMVCVRQYLCNNGKVDETGIKVIEPRLGSGCKYGLEICCNSSEISNEPILNPLPLTVGCGYRNINGVGIKMNEPTDNEAEFGEFPWMVRILERNIRNGKVVSSPKCGGSLIAPRVVLTGAYCVKSLRALNIQVRAGEWESNSNAEPYPHQDRQVVEIILHENFNAENLVNNIALLFLKSAFDAAPHINTVCLPPANTNFDMSRCFASGWGVQNYVADHYPNILKKIDLPVVPRDACQFYLRQTRLSHIFKLHSSFICAGGEIGKDTCKGDGGSPLVCPMAEDPNRYYQAGIVSWGIGCGIENVPGVYTNVPLFRSWIDQKLAYKGIKINSFLN